MTDFEMLKIGRIESYIKACDEEMVILTGWIDSEVPNSKEWNRHVKWRREKQNILKKYYEALEALNKPI